MLRFAPRLDSGCRVRRLSRAARRLLGNMRAACDSPFPVFIGRGGHPRHLPGVVSASPRLDNRALCDPCPCSTWIKLARMFSTCVASGQALLYYGFGTHCDIPAKLLG